MTSERVLITEKLIEQTRIAVAKEWASERGMKNTEDISDEDWIAIYSLLVTKAKLHRYEVI